MEAIGGNVTATLERRTAGELNAIGQRKNTYEVDRELVGHMDFQAGGANRLDYGTKLEDTTHVFLCDFVDLGLKPELNYRLLFKGEVYEILHVDNPMELNFHLEIYLKYTGG